MYPLHIIRVGFNNIGIIKMMLFSSLVEVL